MRVLLAVVVLTLCCMPLAMANGNTVPPPTQPEVIIVPPPVVVTPAPTPGAGPATINTSVTTIPMSVPVLINRSVLNSLPCEPNVVVLVPTTVDPSMASRILANNQIAVVMAPVQLPLVASQAVADRMISGAGPCPVSVDQTSVNRIVTSPNVAMVALVSPVQFDQNMLNMVGSGKPIMMQQSSFSKITPAGQPILAMPMTMSVATSTTGAAGRGPSVSAPLSQAEASKALSGCAVMMAMVAERQTLGGLISNNNLQVVVPMTVPVTVQPGSLTGAFGAGPATSPSSGSDPSNTPATSGTMTE